MEYFVYHYKKALFKKTTMEEKLQYKENTDEELKKTLSDFKNEILKWTVPNFEWWKQGTKAWARNALDTSNLEFDPKTHKLTEKSKKRNKMTWTIFV